MLWISAKSYYLFHSLSIDFSGTFIRQIEDLDLNLIGKKGDISGYLFVVPD